MCDFSKSRSILWACVAMSIFPLMLWLSLQCFLRDAYQFSGIWGPAKHETFGWPVRCLTRQEGLQMVVTQNGPLKQDAYSGYRWSYLPLAYNAAIAVVAIFACTSSINYLHKRNVHLRGLLLFLTVLAFYLRLILNSNSTFSVLQFESKGWHVHLSLFFISVLSALITMVAILSVKDWIAKRMLANKWF